MSITLKDIAKIANVSESTVSRCLNDSPLVSSKTKDKIKKIAEKYNFQFNISARNLATKRTNRIGIIFPNNYFTFEVRHFYSKIEEALFKYIEEKGYEPIIYALNKDKKSILHLINGKEVDGILICSRDIPENDIEYIRNIGFPYAFVYYKPPKIFGELNLYTCDNVDSGYIATEYLIENKCNNIVTITSNNSQLRNYTERTIGYLKALQNYKIKSRKDYIIKCDTSFEAGKKLAFEKADFFKKIDGIFCQQDKVALGLIKGLKSLGFNIPEDISIIGHDNMEVIEFFDPKLTTIQQPFENICKNAVLSTISLIEKKNISYRKIFKSIVIERESVK